MSKKPASNIVYAYEALEYQRRKAAHACNQFNEEYKLGDIIQMWYEHSKWNSSFGIIRQSAILKEVNSENDDNVLEYNGVFVLSLIGGNSDFRDKDGFRECRIMNTGYHYEKVSFDDIIEFRKKEWSHSLEVSIENFKVQKREIKKYKRLLNHNERDLRNDIEKAEERCLR